MGSTTALTIAVIGTIATVAALLIAAGAALVRFGVWKGSVDSDGENFRIFMREVKENCQRIADRLPREAPTSASPKRLTALGERVADALGAHIWSANEAEGLQAKVSGKPPYRVDKVCREYVKNELSPNMREEVLRCAFEQGLEESSVYDVLRVVLRLTLLKKLNEDERPRLTAPEARHSERSGPNGR